MNNVVGGFFDSQYILKYWVLHFSVIGCFYLHRILFVCYENFAVNIQSSGEEKEKEKQITLKTQPPPIEVHLKAEEYDLMTVILFMLSLYCCPLWSCTFYI